MSFLPVKKNDVVVYEGQRYIVSETGLTKEGPIVKMQPIAGEQITVHAAEVVIADETIKQHRRKSVPLTEAEKQTEAKKTRLSEIIAEAKKLLEELGG